MRVGKAWLLGKALLPVPLARAHICVQHMHVLTGPCLLLTWWHINSDIVLLHNQPTQSGRSKTIGLYFMHTCTPVVEVSGSNEVLTTGSSTPFSLSLTHYHREAPPTHTQLTGLPLTDREEMG